MTSYKYFIFFHIEPNPNLGYSPDTVSRIV